MRDVLHSVHSLRPNGIDYIMKQPLVAMPIQTAVKLPVYTSTGETHSN